MSNELFALREVIQRTRELASYYIHKTKDVDVKKRFVVGEKKLNSIYWLVAHLAWAENNLIIRSTGGPNPELPWLKLFALGKPAEEGETNGPSYEEVLAGFEKVHKLAMEHLEKLDPALLETENKINWEIMGSKTMKATLIHHIRHEGTHIGHLSWNAMLHGIKTI
ncbi:MAG TPA: DinB family protein [Bacteroidia bacterium]|nr:DinB family protein [Bacteroidia bacterium]